MHTTCNPAGTPVVLISSRNEESTINIAPMSSIFWLGWRCIIAISRPSNTVENLIREKACVLKLPSVNKVHAVDRLALTTGTKCSRREARKRLYLYTE